MSGMFGSSHILEMGLHYEDYVVTGYLPQLPMIPNLATAHPVLRLLAKTRGSDVTGNIGEIVAAIVANRRWHAQLRGLFHIKATSSHKTPDYLMRFVPTLPTELSQVIPTGTVQPNFNDWPVESKAGGTKGNTKRYIKNALTQLGSYWFHKRATTPSVVGFGLIVSLTYRKDRTITVTVISPSDQPNLQAAIDQDLYKDFIAKLATDGSNVRGFLHDL
jgi:hypothetical protein